jgi:hypothetical protein
MNSMFILKEYLNGSVNEIPQIAPGDFVQYRLLDHVWNKSHKAGALHRVCEFTLVPLADAGTLAGHDLSETGEVATERIRVFVINDVLIHFAEVARMRFCFLPARSHNGGSRGSVYEIRLDSESNHRKRSW